MYLQIAEQNAISLLNRSGVTYMLNRTISE